MDTIDVYQLWMEHLSVRKRRLKRQNAFMFSMFDDQQGDEHYLHVWSHPVRIGRSLSRRDTVLFAAQPPFNNGSMLYTTLAPEDGDVTYPAQIDFQIHILDDRSRSRDTGKALRKLFEDVDLESVAEAIEAIAESAEEDGDASSSETDVEIANFRTSTVTPSNIIKNIGIKTKPIFIYEEVPELFETGVTAPNNVVSAKAILIAKVVGIIIRITPIVATTIGSILENRQDRLIASFKGTKQLLPPNDSNLVEEFDVSADSLSQRANMQGRWEWRAVPAGSINRIPLIKSKSENSDSDDEV